MLFADMLFVKPLLVRVRQLQCMVSLCCRRGTGPQELGVPAWKILFGFSCWS